MEQNDNKFFLGSVVILGSVWGLGECLLGAVLRNCASSVSGSIMTGVALFFIAASWSLKRKPYGIALLITIASLFKMFDALILSLPLRHGAVANPIFSFFMEGAAFILLVSMVKEKLRQKVPGQALVGGMAALVAVNLFPLVKFATGIPACVVPGTTYPLSLYYAPLAVSLSLFTVPLGVWAGEKIKVLETKLGHLAGRKSVGYLVVSLAMLLCLTIVAIAR